MAEWGLSLAAELGIDYVEAYGPYREMRPLLQSNTFEPQGSVPQQCETGRGQFSSEVSAKLAAPQDQEEQAESGGSRFPTLHTVKAKSKTCINMCECTFYGGF